MSINHIFKKKKRHNNSEKSVATEWKVTLKRQVYNEPLVVKLSEQSENDFLSKIVVEQQKVIYYE